MSRILNIALCAHWGNHFSTRRRRHISKTHFCQGGYVKEDAKTHFEDTWNEDEFPPEDELLREDTLNEDTLNEDEFPPETNHPTKTHFEDALNEDELPPEDELPREDTFRRDLKRGQNTQPAPGAFLLPIFSDK